uniref:Pleckstrin and Sec7 domain containing 4 n=1 Tax=Crocodylus porosus TaxID=8502 RepID=A0A7M4DUR0_CROPO
MGPAPDLTSRSLLCRAHEAAPQPRCGLAGPMGDAPSGPGMRGSPHPALTAKALLQASLAQAQFCVLDLQNAMEVSQQPLHPGPPASMEEEDEAEEEDEDEDEDKEEEGSSGMEEEEEEELEQLFHTNPLFHAPHMGTSPSQQAGWGVPAYRPHPPEDPAQGLAHAPQVGGAWEQGEELPAGPPADSVQVSPRHLGSVGLCVSEGACPPSAWHLPSRAVTQGAWRLGSITWTDSRGPRWPHTCGRSKDPPPHETCPLSCDCPLPARNHPPGGLGTAPPAGNFLPSHNCSPGQLRIVPHNRELRPGEPGAAPSPTTPPAVCHSTAFSQAVAEEYVAFFNFSGQSLDQALRTFLSAFVLTGETQERERILRHFSSHFHQANPHGFPSPDAVHTLTCALMLLNTDLHGPNLGRSMTCNQFVANLDGLMDNRQNFPKEQLKVLSSREGWCTGCDPSVSAPSVAWHVQAWPGLMLPAPDAPTYCQGLLARKLHAEADGRRTPWGRRGWKTFYTILKGNQLYFLKVKGWGLRGRGQGAEEPLGVHHALAEHESQYSKRPHVFRLQTADWRVVLFQAPSAEEMNSWVARINLVAAALSAPPFPAAVGSQRKFVRPVLPTAPSRGSLEEQLRAHEAWLAQAVAELGELQRSLPEPRSRSRGLDDYRMRKDYLLYERRRLETYVRVLEARLEGGVVGPGGWEDRLELPPPPAELPRAQSSPSLARPTPASAKVKRNVSERRTIRRVIVPRRPRPPL